MIIEDNLRIEIPQKKDNHKAAELFNTFYFFCTAENRYTPESVIIEWEQPRFSLKDDARIIIDKNGKWLAYVAVLNTESPYTENIIVFRIHPDYLNCGIGSVLTNWAEKKAQENISKAPVQSKVLVRASNFLKMESSSFFLKNLGFSLSRYYFRMIMELPEQQNKITLIPEIRIDTFSNRKNLKEIIECTEELRPVSVCKPKMF